MNSLFVPHSCLLRLSAGLLLAFATTTRSPGCGYTFPNSYLSLNAKGLLAAPEGFFEAELARIAMTLPAERAVAAPKDVGLRDNSAATDIAEVRAALAAGGLAPAKATAAGDLYATARLKLEEWIRARENGRTEAPSLTLSEEVPAEFAHYLRGAAAWHAGQWDDAREAWKAVLALPEAERRNRSVWAAYMLTRLSVERNGDDEWEKVAREAVGYAQQTRALAAAGFSDRLGLAAVSYGWEAQAEQRLDNPVKALNLYLAQHATGDRGALGSVRLLARSLLDHPDESFAALATDRVSREILTAYLVSSSAPRWSDVDGNSSNSTTVKRWADALTAAKLSNVPDVDRLAWLDYEAGEFERARIWLGLASHDVWTAEWLRGKLALRDGDFASAEARLRHARDLLPLGGLVVFQTSRFFDWQWDKVPPDGSFSVADENRTRISGELGRVCLARNDPRGALTAWIEGGHAEDAAFVAERVLTLDQLRAYVDQNCPSAKLFIAEVRNVSDADMRARVRQLLARRLARAGRFDDAVRYYPDDLRPVYETFLADVRLGYDAAKPSAERAAAFWRAAQVTRDRGMELFGTELQPDWAIWDGNFSGEGIKELPRTGWELAPRSDGKAEEDGKAAREEPKRFTYRYRAADLAWWAASLMPNDDVETAKVLHTAGRWIAARDPEAAKKFYQAIVIRCGNTPLGREAAATRWFPD